VDPAILGVFIPIIAVLGFSAWLLARSPVGVALADRIRASGVRHGDGDPRLPHLEQRLLELQTEVSELAERLDFAERLLAERRERKLPAP
jgi:hypothetical protein